MNFWMILALTYILYYYMLLSCNFRRFRDVEVKMTKASVLTLILEIYANISQLTG